MIYDVFEWVMEKLVMPLVIVLIVGAIFVGIPSVIYAEYQESHSAKVELSKAEWACTQSQDVPITTYIMAGKVMVPMTTHESECRQWTHQ